MPGRIKGSIWVAMRHGSDPRMIEAHHACDAWKKLERQKDGDKKGWKIIALTQLVSAYKTLEVLKDYHHNGWFHPPSRNRDEL